MTKMVMVNKNVNNCEQFYQDEENIHKNDATWVDTENLGEEVNTMIQDILVLMKDSNRKEQRGFNKIDRCVLAEWPRKINHI